METEIAAEPLKFVLVGHVDHGKSALIGRLLYDTGTLAPDRIAEMEKSSQDLGRKREFAFLLDSLREEREQGITIDTAQTFFKSRKREYVIIDAPGHREFVRNMITGASQAEAAVLIIDAGQGVKEQTRRHAYILAMLGIRQVVVVLNKMDLVEFSHPVFNQLKSVTEQFLAELNIKAKHYIPVSAIKGDNVVSRSMNMLWYGGVSVLESLDSLEHKVFANDKDLIFPVQDVYKLESKRVLAGRIEAGFLKLGQPIKIMPQGEITTVSTIEKFLETTEFCAAGESIGITTSDAVFAERGNVICLPDKEAPLTDTLRAHVFWMSRVDFDISKKLLLRCATQEVPAQVVKIVKRINSATLEIIEEDAQKLKNLEIGEVIIRTKRPILAQNFNELEELGRFVLVDGEDTCAGGIITQID